MDCLIYIQGQIATIDLFHLDSLKIRVGTTVYSSFETALSFSKLEVIMFKQFIFSALSLLTIVSAVSLYSDSASAQDFNHRDSRERRRGDHRRGFRDGRDCTVLMNQVAESACNDARGGRVSQNDGGACARIMQRVAENPEWFISDVLRGQVSLNRDSGIGSGTRYLAQQAAECQGNREASFDRDVERESNDWHEREERREREGRRQQEGTDQEPGEPSEEDDDF